MDDLILISGITRDQCCALHSYASRVLNKDNQLAHLRIGHKGSDYALLCDEQETKVRLGMYKFYEQIDVARHICQAFVQGYLYGDLK